MMVSMMARQQEEGIPVTKSKAMSDYEQQGIGRGWSRLAGANFDVLCCALIKD